MARLNTHAKCAYYLRYHSKVWRANDDRCKFDVTAPQGTPLKDSSSNDRTYNAPANSSLQGLFKSNTDNSDKYGGSPTENFTRKLSLFTERCEQNDLYGDQIIQSFSIMFCGHALQFSLDSLKGKSMSLEELFTAMRKRFEPEERSRALIRE